MGPIQKLSAAPLANNGRVIAVQPGVSGQHVGVAMQTIGAFAKMLRGLASGQAPFMMGPNIPLEVRTAIADYWQGKPVVVRAGGVTALLTPPPFPVVQGTELGAVRRGARSSPRGSARSSRRGAAPAHGRSRGSAKGRGRVAHKAAPAAPAPVVPVAGKVVRWNPAAAAAISAALAAGGAPPAGTTNAPPAGPASRCPPGWEWVEMAEQCQRVTPRPGSTNAPPAGGAPPGVIPGGAPPAGGAPIPPPAGMAPVPPPPGAMPGMPPAPPQAPPKTCPPGYAMNSWTGTCSKPAQVGSCLSNGEGYWQQYPSCPPGGQRVPCSGGSGSMCVYGNDGSGTFDPATGAFTVSARPDPTAQAAYDQQQAAYQQQLTAYQQQQWLAAQQRTMPGMPPGYGMQPGAPGTAGAPMQCPPGYQLGPDGMQCWPTQQPQGMGPMPGGGGGGGGGPMPGGGGGGGGPMPGGGGGGPMYFPGGEDAGDEEEEGDGGEDAGDEEMSGLPWQAGMYG